jgi:hypothetical protein
MTAFTDEVTPTDGVATLVVIMAGAMLAPTADSMVGRLSMEARAMEADSTVVETMAAGAGDQQINL